MIVPFYAAWWWFASYDIRFLLMITPLVGAAAGLMLDDWMVSLQTRLSPNWRTRTGWLAILCVLALTPFAISKAVNYKGVILSRPFMGDAEKHRVVLGGLYNLAVAVNDLPVGSRIVGVPSMARYHIDLTRFEVVSEKKVTVPPGELTGDFDYAVYIFADGEAPEWVESERPLLETADGYFLYAVPSKDTINP
jgi:hypothetical protein